MEFRCSEEALRHILTLHAAEAQYPLIIQVYGHQGHAHVLIVPAMMLFGSRTFTPISIQSSTMLRCGAPSSLNWFTLIRPSGIPYTSFPVRAAYFGFVYFSRIPGFMFPLRTRKFAFSIVFWTL